MRDVGIFCGTFNPVHWGHLFFAEYGRDEFGLDKVIFVTSPNPPHRRLDLLDAEARHEMVEAACSTNPSFEASRMEIDRQGPSYTVDTLREFRRQFQEGIRLNLLIGQDNLSALHEWHEADVLVTLCRILVAPRHTDVTSADLERELPPGSSCDVIHAPQIPVSGSLIRRRLRAGRSVLYMVTPEVNDLLVSRRHFLED